MLNLLSGFVLVMCRVFAEDRDRSLVLFSCHVLVGYRSFSCLVLLHYGVMFLQETEILPLHVTGAMLAFGVSTVYCWVQTVMSYSACPRLGSRTLCHVRVTICVVASLAFVNSILVY